MRITKTENSALKRDLEEQTGILGRYPRLMRRRNFILVALLLFLAVIAYLILQNTWLATYGRIMAKEISISSTGIGRISAIQVSLGDEVEAGQVIVTLDRLPISAELYKARIALQRNKIALGGLVDRGVDPATKDEFAAATYRLEQQQLKFKTASASYWRRVKMRDSVRRDLESKKGLLLLGSVTKQEYDLARQAENDAQGQVNIAHAMMQEQKIAIESAEHAVEQAQRKLQFSESKLKDDIEIQKLEIKQLEQVLAESSILLAERNLLSPADGTVSWVTKHVGEVVDHNDVILNITAREQRWVEAYIYADDWRHVNNGSTAKVRIKSQQGSWLDGCVFLPYPTERPMDQEYPIGQRVARSPMRLDENIRPVLIRFKEALPESFGTGTIVDAKLRKRPDSSDEQCLSLSGVTVLSPPEPK